MWESATRCSVPSLAWLVLANRTRELTRQHHIKSMPQLFERKRFQSPAMRLFSCIIIFIFLIPYSASVYKGLTSVCSVILRNRRAGVHDRHCHRSPHYCWCWAAIGHTLKADFVQGFVMMFGVAALIVLLVLSPQVGGPAERPFQHAGLHEVPRNGALVRKIRRGPYLYYFDDQLRHLGIAPDGSTNTMVSGIRKEVKRGVVISTFFAPLLVAGAATSSAPSPISFSGKPCPEGGKDFLVPLMLDQAGLPNLLIGVILVLLISASVSTLSSITLTACSTVSMDLVKSGLRRKTMRTKM